MATVVLGIKMDAKPVVDVAKALDHAATASTKMGTGTAKLEAVVKTAAAGLRGLAKDAQEAAKAMNVAATVKQPFSTLITDLKTTKTAYTDLAVSAAKYQAIVRKGLADDGLMERTRRSKADLILRQKVNLEIEKQAALTAKLATLGKAGTFPLERSAAHLKTAEKQTEVLKKQVAVIKSAKVPIAELNAATARYAREAMKGAAAAEKLIGTQKAGIGISKKLEAQMNRQAMATKRAFDFKSSVANVKWLQQYSDKMRVISKETKKTSKETKGLAVSMKQVGIETKKAAGYQRSFIQDFSKGALASTGKIWMAYAGNIAIMSAGFAAAAITAKSFNDAIDLQYLLKYSQAIGDMGDATNDAGNSLAAMTRHIVGIRGVAGAPTELASGFRELIKAGMEAGDIIEQDLVKSLSHFATVAEMEMATAVQLTVTQVKAFGDVTKDAAGDVFDFVDAADMMAAAVFDAPINFADLAQSLKHTTELAVTVGASFDEITTALSLMGESGIKGSQAGTALRTALTKLVTPTKSLSAQIRTLGGDLQDAFDADGTMNVKNAIGLYKDMYDQLDSIAKVRFVKDIFGLRSQKAIAAMMKSFDNWDEKHQKILDSQGNIEQAYAAISETVKIAGQEFLSAFSAEVMEELLPLLEKMPAIIKFAKEHVDEIVLAVELAVKAAGLFAAVWTGAKLLAGLAAVKKAILGINAVTLLAAGNAGRMSTASRAAIGLPAAARGASLLGGPAVAAGVGVALLASDVISTSKESFNRTDVDQIEYLKEAIAEVEFRIANIKENSDGFIRTQGLRLANSELETLNRQLEAIPEHLKSVADVSDLGLVGLPTAATGGFDTGKFHGPDLSEEFTAGVIKAEKLHKKLAESTEKIEFEISLIGLDKYQVDVAKATAKAKEVAASIKALSPEGEITDSKVKSNLDAKLRLLKATKDQAEVDRDSLFMAESFAAAWESSYDEATKGVLAYTKALESANDVHEDMEKAVAQSGMSEVGKLYDDISREAKEFAGQEGVTPQLAEDYLNDLKATAIALGKVTDARKADIAAIIKQGKESNNFFSGFSAGAKEAIRDATKLGAVGYETFNAINQGVKDSLSTSLQWITHGMSEAQDAVKRSLDDTLEASTKTYEEALAALEASFASGETSTEEYEKTKLDILETYNKERLEAQTQYNEDMKSIDSQLGDDIKDIWFDVLDSILDKASDWATDMLFTMGENLMGDLISGFGSGEWGDLGAALGSAASGDWGDALESLGGIFTGTSKQGYAGDAAKVFVVNSGGIGGDAAGTSEHTSSLTTMFEEGTAWDAAGTEIADSFGTALGNNMATAGDYFFGDPNASAWTTAGSGIADAFNMAMESPDWASTAGDYFFGDQNASAWDGQLDKIDWASGFGDDTTILEDLGAKWDELTESIGPYLDLASGGAMLYGGYQAIKDEDYIGGTIQGLGGASQVYQGLTGLGAIDPIPILDQAGDVVALVAGAYGVYSGVKDIMDNGATVGNVASTAGSAYTATAGASALMASPAMGGAGAASTGFAGLSQSGGALSAGPAAAAVVVAAFVAGLGGYFVDQANKHEVDIALDASGQMFEFQKYKDQTMQEGLYSSALGLIDQSQVMMGGAGSSPTADGEVYGFGGISDEYMDETFTNSMHRFTEHMQALAYNFDDEFAKIILSIDPSAQGMDNFIDSMAGFDVALQDSIDMSFLAASAAGGNTASYEELVATLTGLGIASGAAEASAMGMMAAMERYPEMMQLAQESLGQTTVALGTLADATFKLNDGSTEAVAALNMLLPSLTHATQGIGSLAQGMESVAGYEGLGEEAMGNAMENLRDYEEALKDALLAGKNTTGAVAGLSAVLESMGYDTEDAKDYIADFTASLVAGTKDQADSMNEYSDSLSGTADMVEGTANSLENLNSYILDLGNSAYDAVGGINNLSGSISGSPTAAVGYASGGFLEGGSGIADDLYLGTVNGRAQIAMGGEHIMPVAQSQKYASELELMRADKYAAGGFTPSTYTDFTKTDVFGSYTSTSNSSNRNRKRYADIVSILDRINDSLGEINLTDYANEVRQINNGYDETISNLRALGASAADIGFAEEARMEELKEVERSRSDSLSSLLAPAQEAVLDMTGTESQLYSISEQYSQIIKDAKLLGATQGDINTIFQAQAIEVAEVEEQRVESLMDMIIPMSKNLWAMEDMELWMYELSSRYEEAVVAAKELGASEYELRIIRNSQTAEIQDQIDGIMDSVGDIIDKDTLSELEYNSNKVNEKFDGLSESLIALGATTSDITDLEMARQIELDKVSGVDPMEYYDSLLATGARVSTFGSQDAFGPLNSEVQVTVLVDGNGIINDGELNSRIIDVSDDNSFSKDRRDYDGQTTYPGVI